MFRFKPNLLQGRIILATGASKGIGRAVSFSLASYGATVILLGRSVKLLETLYDDIVNEGYPEPAICPFNLETATPDAYERLKVDIEKNFGRLDGLLFNAAQLGSLTPIEHYPLEQWYSVLQTNLNSSFILTQTLLPLLKLSEDASVVFTTGNIYPKAKAYFGAYAVSKFGLEGLAQVLSEELETNTKIRVNSIHPEKIRTELRAKAYPAEDPNTVPVAHTILPWYLYLLGPESKGITGKTFEAKPVESEQVVAEKNDAIPA